MVNAYVLKFARQGYSAKTVSHHLSVLRLIFTKSIIEGIIDNNPAEYVSVPPGLSKMKRTPPNPQDVEKIKSNIDKPFGLFPYFILYTGLRKSEALALQWQDIDFEKKEINVSKAWYVKNNRPYIKIPKTEAGKRIVPLLAPLEEVLKPGTTEEYIFGFPAGREYSAAWSRYRKLTGITCTAHQLRHEYVTFLYDAGIDEFDAMNIVGHSDIATMRNIYTHIKASRREKVTDILNSKISSKRCGKCGSAIEGSPKFCPDAEPNL